MNAIIIIVIVIVIVLHSAAKVTNLLQFISDSCPVSYFHMIFTVFTQHIHDNCIWFSTALAWPGLAWPCPAARLSCLWLIASAWRLIGGRCERGIPRLHLPVYFLGVFAQQRARLVLCGFSPVPALSLPKCE